MLEIKNLYAKVEGREILRGIDLRVNAGEVSMTAPGCGMGDVLKRDASTKVQALAGVTEVDVEIVWEPPWDDSRMSEAAKLQLGMFRVKAVDRNDATTKNVMKRPVRVAHKGDLELGTGTTVDVNGTPVVLFNVDGLYHAIHNFCPYEEGSLGDGELCHAIVIYPLHDYEFDVTSGRCLTEPAYSAERFEVLMAGDDILVGNEVAVPDARAAAARAGLANVAV